MPSPVRIIKKKRASLRVDRADLTWLADKVAGLDGRIGVSLARRIYGGDWIEGEARLTEDSLHFVPSGLNRIALKNGAEYERGIKLKSVKEVRTRWHVLQHIIDIELESGETVSLNCPYGAGKFASRIEAQVRHARI